MVIENAREVVADEVLGFEKNVQEMVAVGFKHVDDALKEPAKCCMLLPRTTIEKLPQFVKVLVKEPMMYKKEKCCLLIVEMAKPEGISPADQCAAIRKSFEEQLEATQEKVLEDFWFWPLHYQQTSAALLWTEERMAFGYDAAELKKPCLLRPLHWLYILIPLGGGGLVQALREQHGPAVAFDFLWHMFFVQNLWFLSPVLILWVAGGLDWSSTGETRIGWEFAKLAFVLWGVQMAIRQHWWMQRRVEGKSRDSAVVTFSTDDPEANVKKLVEKVSMARSDSKGTEASDYDHAAARSWCSSIKRWVILAVLVVPALTVYVCLVNLALLGVAQLIVYESYVWGDCLKLNCYPPSPQNKWGFLGWLVEVATDVLLALSFEIFYEITKPLARWLASLRNYRRKDDHRLSVEMLSTVIACFDRIGTFGFFAFLFVPQWEAPTAINSVNLNVDCSDLFLKSASFFCLQRQLPVSSRRAILKRTLRGPFCVAPFVAILMKVIVPAVAERLERISRRKICSPCFCCPCRFIGRTAAAIFSYDCDSVVGGIPCIPCFGLQGIPWARETLKEVGLEIVQDPDPSTQRIQLEQLDRSQGERLQKEAWLATCDELSDAERESLIFEALAQGARKPWEPEVALMELEMAFLWVIFFGPIFPLGVIVTTIAKFLEVKFHLPRLLYVRRRCVPERDARSKRIQRAFLRGAVLGSFGWTVGYSLLTYNDNLYAWGYWKTVIALGLGIWLVLSAGVVLVHMDFGWGGIGGAVGFFIIIGASCLAMFDQLITKGHTLGL